MPAIHRPREYTAKKNSAFKFGNEVKHDVLRNCLTCDKWAFCKDPNKAAKYRCSRYNEASLDDSSIDGNPLKFFGLTEEPDIIRVPQATELSTEEEETIDKMIAKAISDNSPIPPDIKLNDREIPMAPNFITWLLDEKFTGGGMPPFPRQIYVGSMLFAEVCSRCTDMEWFEHMKVDCAISKIQARVEFLENGRCKRCGTNRFELVEEGEIPNYNELTMICGQRSSKSSSINLMDSYNIHRYLKLPNPAKVYRQLPQQVFTTTYTSRTFGQVRQNVWEPFLNIINGSNWFKNYHKFLARRGEELGEELAVVSEIFVRYRHRNLFISPASPSGQTMRGRTRLSAFIDEISHMALKNASGKDAMAANAKDTYIALRNSLDTLNIAYKSRFAEGYFDLPKPLMYNASSPATINDYGMQLLRSSRLSDEMFGVKYKTWEFNPTLPESYFANRFRVNPVDTARDFACEPPIGNSTWLTDTEVVSKAFGHKRNMYRVNHQVKRSRSGKKITSASLTKQLNPNFEYGCVLAIDVGSVNNSFAFAVCTVGRDFDLAAYLDEDSEAEEATARMVPMRAVFVGEVIPRKGAEISQSELYTNIFSQLCEEIPIQLVISDRWQNKKLVQDLETEFGCEYAEFKLRWEDFENLKNALYDGEIELPALKTSMEDIVSTTLDDYPHMFENKPIEHLAYQMITVQEARGNTVIKGDATDDMFRCIALAHAMMQDRDFLEDLIIDDNDYTPRAALGVVSSMNAGRGLNQRVSSLTGNNGAGTRALLFRKGR